MEHVFCRWEGLGHPNPAWRAQFNFDGAGKGFSIDPDEFYLTWPRKSSSHVVVLCDLLKSLSPRQELAVFLLSRGHVLTSVRKDYANAQIAYAHAARLWPTSRKPLQFLSKTSGELWKKEFASHPKIYRMLAQRKDDLRMSMRNDNPRPRPWWKTSQGQAANLAEVRRVNEINRRNMQRMIQPVVPTPSMHHPHRPGQGRR